MRKHTASTTIPDSKPLELSVVLSRPWRGKPQNSLLRRTSTSLRIATAVTCLGEFPAAPTDVAYNSTRIPSGKNIRSSSLFISSSALGRARLDVPWQSMLSLANLWCFAILSLLPEVCCTSPTGACKVQNGDGQVPRLPASWHQELYASCSHQAC